MMSPGLSVWMSSRPAASACLDAWSEMTMVRACSGGGSGCGGRIPARVGGAPRAPPPAPPEAEAGALRPRAGAGAGADRHDAGDAVVELTDGRGGHSRDRLVGGGHLGLQFVAHLLGAPLVGDARERRDGLNADLALRSGNQRQQGVDQLAVAELAEC